MSKKGIIIGIFIRKSKILSFLEELRNKFYVKIDRVFVYNIESNENEYLVTFKTFNKDIFIKNLQGSSVMHVKNNCIFSINALNKLIESEKLGSEEKSNNEIEVDWDKYKDKLIILTNGVLNIVNLSKIEDKCVFLS
jgi:hypothetical protein